ncbi:hypothetical protein H4219_003822 [Mycoemilia scoparia]|uniref:Uncharacterized protein n=1 Tax=Mycoemilia scoparia TaxID=417184 RepID=A0A9W8DMC2_9FUNG|nr:hypothetical protein H4219_003822 [Mycoemilia scoparia]
MASMDWYETVLQYNYTIWKYENNFKEYSKVGNRYISRIYLDPGYPPCDEFFDLKCPKLTDLQLPYDPELVRKLSKFTKLNPTITDLYIECNILEQDLPIIDQPTLFELICPLYQRLYLLELKVVIKLPSLSFLLENLPNLGTLELEYCVLKDISDIFVPRNSRHYQHNKPPHSNNSKPKSPPNSSQKKPYYSLTRLSFSRWFTTKNQLKEIMNGNLVFNADIFPNLDILTLQAFLENIINIPISDTNFGPIPHPCFMSSVRFKSITDLRLYKVTFKLLNNIAESCPNLEKLSVLTFYHANDPIDIILSFRSIAEYFPKLISLVIWMWKKRTDDDSDFPITNDMSFYSETLDYALGLREIADGDSGSNRTLYLLDRIHMNNSRVNRIQQLPHQQQETERQTAPRNDIIQRIQTPMKFSCSNMLRSLCICTLGNILTPDILLPIAQFTNLIFLEIEFSTLYNIQLQKNRIQDYYSNSTTDPDHSTKPFGKLVDFTLNNNGFNENIEQFMELIKLFPALRIFHYNEGDQYCRHHSDSGNGSHDKHGDFFDILKQAFPDLLFVF